MIIPITLERKDPPNKDEFMVFDLEADAQVRAKQKEGRAPTLTELLYNQTEDDVLTITELLENE